MINTQEKINNIYNSKIWILLTSLILWEIGIIILIFNYPVLILSFIIFIVSIIFYLLWVKKSKFKPFKNNPYKNPNISINQRDSRIKIIVLFSLGILTFLQIGIFSIFNFGNINLPYRFFLLIVFFLAIIIRDLIYIFKK